MRRIILLAAVTACAQQSKIESGGAVVGTTTYARGAEVVRVDTPAAKSPPRSNVPAPTGGDVTLRLDQSAYTKGSPLTLTIRNDSRDTLGYNQCSSRTLERKEGFATWVVYPEPGRMCTMELRLLSPGEMQVVTTDIPSQVSAGTYRLVLTLMPQRTGASSVRIISAEFAVR